MKKLLPALFMGLILILGACGGGGDESAEDNTTEEQTDEGTEESPEEDSKESASDGGESDTVDTAGAEEVYQNNCANCHGGELGGGFGPALTNVGSDYSADEIVEIIQNGKGSMPAQNKVSEEDAKLVASWLETMK